MAMNRTTNLSLGGVSVTGVKLTWGATYPDERTDSPAYGVTIELPAVLKLLELAVDGRATAVQVHEALRDLGAQVVAQCDPHGCGVPECDGTRCDPDDNGIAQAQQTRQSTQTRQGGQ